MHTDKAANFACKTRPLNGESGIIRKWISNTLIFARVIRVHACLLVVGLLRPFYRPPVPIRRCFLFFSGAAAAPPGDIFAPLAAAAPLKNKKLRKDTTRGYKQDTPRGVTKAGL
jgi:hypothetical protein